jgi:hypothetical protein
MFTLITEKLAANRLFQVYGPYSLLWPRIGRGPHYTASKHTLSQSGWQPWKHRKYIRDAKNLNA